MNHIILKLRYLKYNCSQHKAWNTFKHTTAHPKNFHPKTSHPENFTQTISTIKFHPKNFHKKKIHPKNFSPKKISPKKFSPKKISPKKFSPKKCSPKIFTQKNFHPKNFTQKKCSLKKCSPNKFSPKKISTPTNFRTKFFFTESVRLSFVDLRWAQLYVSLVGTFLQWWPIGSKILSSEDVLQLVTKHFDGTYQSCSESCVLEGEMCQS